MAFPRCFAAFLVFAFIPLPGSAVRQDLDGLNHAFTDPLLDHMTGTWNLTGKIMDRNADHAVDAEWVLNHQFLRIHEKDRSPAASDAVLYEAMVMVGHDNMSERYVAHWNDIYGGRFSETLGDGIRNGNDIRFVFAYPNGPVHTTFRWLPESHQWTWRMETKSKSGHWTEFAMLTLTPAGKS